MIQEDLNEGLKKFQVKSFDYVILSKTLEYIADPVYLIKEMLRVGRKCIISFENIANWKNRLIFMFTGTLKREYTDNYNLNYGKKIQILSIKKFLNVCDYFKINMINIFNIPSKKYNLTRIFPNLFSKIAIFILQDNKSINKNKV